MKVIFRTFRNGEVIALFPEMAASQILLCGSYMHIGQHGDADPYVCIGCSKPSKEEEYRELKQELEEIGYSLEVVKRMSGDMVRTRIAEWRQYHDC